MLNSYCFAEKRDKFSISIRKKQREGFFERKREIAFSPQLTDDTFINEISNFLLSNQRLSDEACRDILGTSKVEYLFKILLADSSSENLEVSSKITESKKVCAHIMAYLSLAPCKFWSKQQFCLLLEILRDSDIYDVALNLFSTISNLCCHFEFRDLALQNEIDEILFEKINRFQLTKSFLSLIPDLVKNLAFGPPFPISEHIYVFNSILISILMSDKIDIHDVQVIKDALLAISFLTDEIQCDRMYEMLEANIIDGLLNCLTTYNEEIDALVLKVFVNISYQNRFITNNLIEHKFFMDEMQRLMNKTDPRILYHFMLIISNLAEGNEKFIDIILMTKKKIMDCVIFNFKNNSENKVLKEAGIALSKILEFANGRQRVQIFQNSEILSILLLRLTHFDDLELKIFILRALNELLRSENKFRVLFESYNGPQVLNELRNEKNIDLSSEIDELLNKIESIIY